jgi:hypothetical protein
MSEPVDGSRSPPSVLRDARGALALIFRSPIVIPLVGTLTFVTLLATFHRPALQGLAFLHSGRTPLWHMLFALTPTAWVTSIVMVLGDFKMNRSTWPRTRREWMAAVICTGLSIPFGSLPILAQSYAWKEDPLVLAAILRAIPHTFTQRTLMNLLGLAAGALLIFGSVLVIIQLLARFPEYKRREEQHTLEDLDEDVRWYQESRSRLRWFLNLTAIVAGTSLLSLGALRNLINLANPAPTELFPITSIMGYGIYYTGILGAFYLTVGKILKDVGQTLTARLVHQALGERATWKQRSEQQQAARVYLGLRYSAFQELQRGITVLTPLFASIFSLLLSPSG